MKRPRATARVRTDELRSGDVVWLGDNRYNVFLVEEAIAYDHDVTIQRLADNGTVIDEKTVKCTSGHEWAVSSRLPT